MHAQTVGVRSMQGGVVNGEPTGVIGQNWRCNQISMRGAFASGGTGGLGLSWKEWSGQPTEDPDVTGGAGGEQKSSRRQWRRQQCPGELAEATCEVRE